MDARETAYGTKGAGWWKDGPPTNVAAALDQIADYCPKRTLSGDALPPRTGAVLIYADSEGRDINPSEMTIDVTGAASGLTGLAVNGDIVVSGTVDGVDVSSLAPPTAARYSLSANAGSFTTTWTTLALDREDVAASWISNSSGEFTISSSGVYAVQGTVTVQQTAGNNRTEFQCVLQVDTGSGFADSPGTFAFGYSRNSSIDKDTMPISTILSLSASDVIRIQARRSSGVATGQFDADANSLSIIKLS